jgi:hypothetical protein
LLHQAEANDLDMMDRSGRAIPDTARPYTRDEILAYWAVVDGMIDAGVDALDLDAAESGFPWYPISKLEHQLVNLRHVQHHAAALSTRLRREAGIAVPWVGSVKESSGVL